MPAYKTAAQRLLEGFERVLFSEADIELPEEPGLYFVTSRKGSILYIGQSQNMRRRWRKGHHQTLPCMRAGAHYIYYQYTTEPHDIEPLYIDEFRPPLNNTGPSG